MKDNEFRNPRIIVKNGVYLFARYALVMFIAFYTTRLTLQVLGEEDYGINNVIGGLISMFAVVSMPITSALQRFFNVEFARKEISPLTVFNTSLRIIGLIIFLMMLLYETIGLYLVKEVIQYPLERENAVIIIFHLTAIMTVLSFAMVPYTAFLFAKEDMGIPAAVELFGSLFKLVFLWVIPFVPSDSLVVYTLFLLSLYVIQLLFYVVYCNKKYIETRLAKLTDRLLGKSILQFAGWNSIEAIAGLSITYLSSIIINVFGGVIYNTAYGLSKSLNTAVSSLTTNLIKAVEPQITSSTVVEDDNYRNGLVISTIKLAFLCVGYIVVFFYFSGEAFLEIWLGKVPSYTYEFCLVMLFAALFSSVILPLRSTIIATGKIQKYFIYYGIVSSLSLVIMYLLLKLGSPIIFSVVIIALCNAVFFIVAIDTSVKVTSLKVSDILKTIAVSIICLFISFVVYGVCIHYLSYIKIWGVLVAITVSLAVLAITTYHFALNEIEKEMIRTIVNKIKIINR